MSLLKKLGIVEEDEEAGQLNTPRPRPDSSSKPDATTFLAEDPAIKNARETDLISVAAIYKTAGLSDASKSIYKVEELKNALPASLDLKAMKDSVIGVMKVAGLSMDQALMDSDKRITALMESKEKLAADVQLIISANLTEIEKLEKRVNELKQINTEKKKIQEDQQTSIQAEIERIDIIVKFIS